MPNPVRYSPFPGERLDLVTCRDCSTRSTVVTIPADERDAHDFWHDMPEDANDRHAVIKGKGHADLAAIRRYLPHNYIADSDGGNVWIHGYDHLGWTLDGYVIPRLASGLYFAKEVTV